MKILDLRSDTITKPSKEMRKAMYEAEVGDDVYSEDPSINKLQDIAAEITGKEKALFVTSGSMGNLIPAILNCGKGNEFIIDARGHMIHYELASAAAIAGSLPVAVQTADGILRPELLEDKVRPDIYYMARTKMIVIENTHNLAGGTYYTLDALKDVYEFAGKHNLKVHMDGARLFNASEASKLKPDTISEYADTVTFCLSKGLGAPVGALLCGSGEFINEARRVRKMLGGGMRQAGILAAAGIYALQHNTVKIREDHEKAKLIAEALSKTSWAKIDKEKVVTNIIYFDTPGRTASEIVEKLKAKGILSGASGDSTIRMVTHIDISTDDIQKACRIIETLDV